MRNILCVLCALWVFSGGEFAGQTRVVLANAVLAEILLRPTPLRDGIGRVPDSLTSSTERARAYHQQGLAYLHSFVWIEAARSFNEALRLDGDMPMAYLGLSFALGELGESAAARQTSGRAEALSAKANERERFRIELRAKQLAASARPQDQPLQAAYRKQLDLAFAKYPRDVELLLLVGQAQEPTHLAHGMGAGSSAIRFYELALVDQPNYFAVHHYLTHAYENINSREAAFKHAAIYVEMAPAIPHAHHMHGHLLRRVGRLKEAIAEFRTAEKLDLDYQRAENIPASLNWHYRHNLDLLGASYVYAGQLRLAEPILRQSFQTASMGSAQDLSRKTWPMFLLAHGRANEALTAVNLLVNEPTPLVRALGHVLRSRVMQALGRMQAAAEDGNAGLRQMRASDTPGGLLLPDFQLAQGEYLLRTGETEKGRAMLRDAVAKLRAETGPDAWTQTLFTLEASARTVRELKDWTLASAMSDEMRRHDAEYAGTRYALALVAEQRGDLANARLEYAEAVRRWPDADADLPDLLDARRRLAALGVRGR